LFIKLSYFAGLFASLNLRVEGSIPSRLTISRVNAINDLRRSQPRPQMGIELIDPHPQFTATSSSR